MSFAKQIIEIAAEGFAGETVQHIITKTNLKNQPELAEKFKEGDTVSVVKAGTDKPIVGNSAATKTKTKSATKEVVVNKVPEEDKTSEIKGDPKRAKEIADAQGIEVVFENDKGEFFTSENLVRLSVGNDKSKIKVHTF